MKFFHNALLWSILAAPILLIGCENSKKNDIISTVSTCAGCVEVNGVIEANATWKADKVYWLTSKVVVKDGVTLTIEPGVIVKGRYGLGQNATALIVARGGKIEAKGTADKPIIFTSEQDNIQVGQRQGTNLNEGNSGLWGGLIVLGRAPVYSSATGGAFPNIEGIPPGDKIGNQVFYGGNDAQDNSGMLSYISIRHGGASIGEGNEINGLTLGGVGSGTTIDHVEVVANSDDGIEFFGGTVNVSHALIWAQEDDGFDLDQGYHGTLMNFVFVAGGETTGSGLEIDGPEGKKAGDVSGVDVDPAAIGFTLRNGILIGLPTNNNNNVADFRDNASGLLENCIVKNFSASSRVLIKDPETLGNYQNSDLTKAQLQIRSLYFVGSRLVEDFCAVHKDFPGKTASEGKTPDEIAALKQSAEASFKGKMKTDNQYGAAEPNTGPAKSDFSWTFAAHKGALDGLK